MHASTLIRAAGMALVTAMLVLTSELAGAKLSVPTEEQKAQAGLAGAKAAWGDKVAALQTCKAQGKAATSYQTGGKAAHTQPGVSCVDLGPSIAPVSAALALALAAKG